MSPDYGKCETLMTKRLKEIIGHQFSTKSGKFGIKEKRCGYCQPFNTAAPTYLLTAWL